LAAALRALLLVLNIAAGIDRAVILALVRLLSLLLLLLLLLRAVVPVVNEHIFEVILLLCRMTNTACAASPA
jgi:hypothetical protein